MMSNPLTELGYAQPLATHPRAFIVEEMQARGWTPEDLARRLGDGSDLSALGWLIYFSVENATVVAATRLGPELAADLARVFGTSAELWLNLERQWLERVA